MIKNIFILCLLLSMSEIHAQVSGSFEIGKGGDYQTLAEALNPIKANGLDGHVVFHLLPGNFEECIYLKNIKGLSKNQTLTIRARDGAGTVTIKTISNNPIPDLIYLKNCPNVTFENISFSIGNQSIGYFEGDTCDYLRLINCTFMTPSYSAYSSGGYVKISNSNSVVIKNSYLPRELGIINLNQLHLDSTFIRTGFYDKYIFGGTINANDCDTVFISNCEIKDYGIWGTVNHLEVTNTIVPDICLQSYSDFVKIHNCNFLGGGISSCGPGIFSNNSFTGYLLRKVKIDVISCENCIIESNNFKNIAETAIHVYGNGIIRNNMVGPEWDNTISGEKSGIIAHGEFKIYHNTISLKNATVTKGANGIKISGNKNEDIRYNIIAIEHDLGYAINSVSSDKTFKSQYNVLCNPDGPLVKLNQTEYNTLTEWSDSTGKDRFSVNSFPKFWSDADIHIRDPNGIINVTTDSLVSLDIDGETRGVITQVGADHFSCNHLDVNLSNTTLEVNMDSADYQWLDCGNDYAPILGENQKSFTPEYNGDYTVEITSNRCNVTFPCFSITEAGTKDTILNDTTEQDTLQNAIKSIPGLGKEYWIFPNPAQNIITILNSKPIGLIQIIDCSGRVVKIISIEGNKIDVSDLKTGVYFLRLSTGADIITKKIIIY